LAGGRTNIFTQGTIGPVQDASSLTALACGAPSTRSTAFTARTGFTPSTSFTPSTVFTPNARIFGLGAEVSGVVFELRLSRQF
jgi:hypothetical protein